MNVNETAALVRALDRAYINGKFVTPHGSQVVDLVNPTNNTVVGKVTMADEIDTRQAIAKVAPAIAAGCTVVIKPSEISAMQTEVLMEARSH